MPQATIPQGESLVAPTDAFAWFLIALLVFVVVVLWRIFKDWADARYPGWDEKEPRERWEPPRDPFEPL